MKKLALLCIMILPGCMTTPITQFYDLEAINVSITSQTTEKKPLVGVSQISLPSTLERKQIVTRSANGQLHLAEQHQWATLLKQNMTEVLAKNLAVKYPEFWFKAHPWSLLGIVDYRLVVDVIRLDIILGKAIYFSVDWTFLNEKNHAVLQHSTIDLTQPLADDNYSTAVEGVNKLLMQLSEKLAVLKTEQAVVLKN